MQPLQAADFAAWEARKNHLNQNEWWELKDRPQDPDDGWAHMMKWSQEKYGTLIPRARKSMEALVESVPFEGIVWDYRTLCVAHEARGGAWS
jgi:hypothetical protein